MRMKSSYRFRFILSLWVVFFLTLYVYSSHFIGNLNEARLEERKHDAVRDLNFVAWLITQDESADRKAFNDWLTRVGGNMGLRLTYIAEGGRVIADSQVPFAEVENLDNHASRPEVMGARQEQMGMSIRYSGTLRTDLLYVARAVEGHDSIPSGILRLAVPLSSPAGKIGLLDREFIGIGLLFLLGISLLGYFATKRLQHSLDSLVRNCEDLTEGNLRKQPVLDTRDPLYPVNRAFAMLVDQMELLRQGCAESEKNLEALMDGMQEGVMLLDSQGKIQRVNKAFERIAPGFPRPIGRHPIEIFRNADLQDICNRKIPGKDSTLEDYRDFLQIKTDRGYLLDVNIICVRYSPKKNGAVLVFHRVN